MRARVMLCSVWCAETHLRFALSRRQVKGDMGDGSDKLMLQFFVNRCVLGSSWRLVVVPSVCEVAGRAVGTWQCGSAPVERLYLFPTGMYAPIGLPLCGCVRVYALRTPGVGVGRRGW